MFQTPENRIGQGEAPKRPVEDFDLDFTKPQGVEVTEDFSEPRAKIESLKKGIAIAKRGIELAKKFSDPEMEKKMTAKVAENEATIALLQSSLEAAEVKTGPAVTMDVADFDTALGADRTNLIKRTDAWKKANPEGKIL
jgi:hypothetical protein